MEISNKEIKEQVKSELREFKAKGRVLSVGLNSSLEKLQNELSRLKGEVLTPKVYEDLEPPSFGEPEIIVNADTEVLIEELQTVTEIGFDIETSITNPHEGEIRLYQVYVPETDTCFIWDTKEPNCNEEPLIKLLNNPKVKKSIHNALFEYSWIREKHGIQLMNVLDTMILSQLSKAGLYTAYQKAGFLSSNSLKTLSKEYGFEYDKSLQQYDYDDLNPIPWAVYQYGAFDAKATYLLSKKIEIQSQPNKPVQDIDLKINHIFGEMNHRGMPSNIGSILDLRQQYKEVWKDLHAYVQDGRGINPDSPKQLIKEIRERYGIVPFSFDRKEKKMKESTNKQAINQFIAAHPELDTEYLLKIQEYRSIKKVGEDYTKQFLSSYREGRIYGKYSILGFQGEGRSSCKSPNLQNISKHTAVHKKYNLPALRSVFEAENDFVFIEIDLAAAHAQIARYLSNDANLVKSQLTGLKMHFYTLVTILASEGIYLTAEEIRDAKNDPDNHYHKKVNLLYKLSKNVFYSFLNYSGKNTLQDTFCKEDVIITTEKCGEYLTATAKTFNGLRNFQDQLIQKVESRFERHFSVNGQFIDAVSYLYVPDGSIIYYPYQLTTPSKICASVWLRVEATSIKKAMLEINNEILVNSNNQAEFVNFSHDSFVIHAHKSIAENVADKACEILIKNISEYIKDYTHEYEVFIDSTTGLTRQPKKGEKVNPNLFKGYTISKKWS